MEDVEACDDLEPDEEGESEQDRSYKGVELRLVPTIPKLGLGVLG